MLPKGEATAAEEELDMQKKFGRQDWGNAHYEANKEI